MLTIGQLARAAGVGVEAVRYYEQIRLMPSPQRTEGGHRVYDDDARRRLTFIRRARQMGFTLDQVRELLRLAQDEGQPCAAVVELATKHLLEVRAKMKDLTRLEAILGSAVTRCATQAVGSHCAVLEMLSE